MRRSLDQWEPHRRSCAPASAFYQLGALSMLLGGYTLNNVLALRPGQTGKVLFLLFTLNLYEALLIGLGLFPRPEARSP